MADFHKLLNFSIVSARYIQFGCGQEPTLDSRLPEFFSILSSSKISPEKISMITNGSFLSRHHWKDYVESGLKELQVSIDTIFPAINNQTRSGTDIAKILSDLEALSMELPGLDLVFSITVNSMSIHSLESLFDFGRKISVKSYYVREVFDRMHEGEPKRRQDYDDWIEKLTLKPGEFEELQQRLSQHSEYSKMTFVSSKYADKSSRSG